MSDVDELMAWIEHHHGHRLRAVAYANCHSHEDAEDAYQFGLMKVIENAARIPESAVIPWLTTVIKREAWHLASKREASFAHVAWDGEDWDSDPPSLGPSPQEHAEASEYVRSRIAAMAKVKQREREALVLIGLGYSYPQIMELKGWSHRQVERFIIEGRAAARDALLAVEEAGW